jgi:hypothetical protein
MGGTSLQVPTGNLPATKWSVLSIDVANLFETHKLFSAGLAARKLVMRGFTINASVLVKGIYTSDKEFISHIPKTDRWAGWEKSWKSIDVWNEDTKL